MKNTEIHARYKNILESEKVGIARRDKVKRLAKKLGVSEAEIIRRAIDNITVWNVNTKPVKKPHTMVRRIMYVKIARKRNE